MLVTDGQDRQGHGEVDRLGLSQPFGVYFPLGAEDPTLTSFGTAAEATAGTDDAGARAEAVAKEGEAEAKAEAKAEAAAAAAEKKVQADADRNAGAGPKGETVTVTNVIDGDTVDLSNGERVRVIGIDTPERGECGFTAATKYMESLVLGKQVNAVPGARDDRDRYDRTLRYLDVGKADAGLAVIEKGYGTARYDSRDGFGAHPREDQYVDADELTADNFVCESTAPVVPPAAPQPALPAPQPAPQPAPPAPQPAAPQPAPPAPGPGAGYTGCRAYIGGPYIDDQGRHYTPIDCQTRQPLVP
jgi:endonuclease YncB( thermonuclease family)